MIFSIFPEKPRNQKVWAQNFRVKKSNKLFFQFKSCLRNSNFFMFKFVNLYFDLIVGIISSLSLLRGIQSLLSSFKTYSKIVTN